MKNRFYLFPRPQILCKIVPAIIFSLISCIVFFGDVYFLSKLQIYFSLPLSILLLYLSLNFIVTTIQLIFYDPGYVSLSDLPYEEFCEKCNQRRPKRAHHCSKCKKCVRKFDHHCDVYQSCIAAWNMPYFFKFFIIGGVIGLFTLVQNLVIFFVIIGDDRAMSLILVAGGFIIFLVTLTAGSALWFQPICKDMTQVEDLVGVQAQQKTILQNMQMTLGKYWPVGLFIIFWKFQVQDPLDE